MYTTYPGRVGLSVGLSVRISYRVIICFICRMQLLPEVFLMAIKEQSIKASFTFAKSKVILQISVRLKKKF